MPKPRSHAEPLRLPLHDGAEPPPTRRSAVRRAISWGLGALLLGALALVPPAWGPLSVRVLLAVAFVVVVALRMRRARVSDRAPSGWIVVDSRGLARLDASGTKVLADWTARFGVTMLTNQRRDRGLLAFTTVDQTRYVRVRADAQRDEAEAAAARELFARASLASDSDVLLGAHARGDDDVALSAVDALLLAHRVRARAAESLDRIFLSDSRGAPIVLEKDELRIGERVIDLRSPVEWRGFMFFESAGHMSTLVQATWVRQQAVELVLVAPMPAEVSGVRRVLGGDVEAERAAARDLRLMQAAPDQAPPHELRTAIERLFMVPLRAALDRAPGPPERDARSFGEPRARSPGRPPEGHAS